jgi:glutaredoxin
MILFTIPKIKNYGILLAGKEMDRNGNTTSPVISLGGKNSDGSSRDHQYPKGGKKCKDYLI